MDSSPGRIFTNPTLIELRQEISEYHWLQGAVTSLSALARSFYQGRVCKYASGTSGEVSRNQEVVGFFPKYRQALKALFPQRVASQTSSRSRFVLVDCARWNSDQLRNSHGPWIGKSLGSARINGCTDAVCSLHPPLMRELFTVITRETIDALTSPRATSILPVPTMGNIADGTSGKTGRRNAA
ncbi:hypothetical protein AVEN_267468-1 [Araneus ventricosus]|uniref:Uncharacterized protein n=1 Tax=Araneus ventricosus TaxID=182803 RepID=A0A4Y2TL84_ARAVE|nr:hypothetical protein AVEN_267468-1 [Araneus ventricosus]